MANFQRMLWLKNVFYGSIGYVGCYAVLVIPARNGDDDDKMTVSHYLC